MAIVAGCVDLAPPPGLAVVAPADARQAPAGDGPVTDAPAAPEDWAAPDTSLDQRSLANGAPCTDRSACESGQCVDGVCCPTACGSPCHACNVPGSMGVCVPVSAGEDPGDDCKATAETSCGQDGTCDGRGGCRLHRAGTACGARTCRDGVEHAAATCDGLGVCRPAQEKPCAPYVCGLDACATTCSNPGDCAGGSACEAGRCSGKLPAGATCMAGSQCVSGSCVDGVCCTSSCAGPCQACNLSGTVGICTPIPDGQDPGDDCAEDTGNVCGTDGQCDGRGACRLRAVGTACAAASCASGMETTARTCDGMGGCRSPTTRACTPYACGAAACLTRCDHGTGCAPGHGCEASGACEPNPAALVARWRFDEGAGTTVADVSGNGNTARFGGATGTLAWIDARPGAGKALDIQASRYLEVAGSPSLDTVTTQTGLTITAWVNNSTNAGGFRGIVTRQGTADDKLDMYALWVRDLTDLGFACAGQEFEIDNGPLTPNVWRHVAVTVERTQAKLFVDGVRRGTTALQCTFTPTTRPLVIGGNLNGPTDPATLSLKGYVDDVQIFARTLSEAEVAAIARR